MNGDRYNKNLSLYIGTYLYSYITQTSIITYTPSFMFFDYLCTYSYKLTLYTFDNFTLLYKYFIKFPCIFKSHIVSEY